MAEHNDIGKAGEALAQKYLKDKGYTILETNWRHGKDEIDIIATDGKFLVIAEVKTRQSNRLGEPEVSVNRDKQRFLVRAADAYIQRKNIGLETRFDIISILMKNENATINHIVDAFYPTL
jgi:putative endonuclease